MTPTYLTYLLQKKRLGARKNEERILDWPFFFGCFFCPRKNHALRISRDLPKKEGVDSVFCKVLLDLHWPPVLRSDDS